MASASDEAREIRDEVGFFQAIRAALAKSSVKGGLSTADKTLAVQQLIDQSIASADNIDVLQAAGMKAPDISILSDEFLLEVAGMEKKNLALEALKKLLAGEIKSRSRTNVVESKAFSQRLEDAVARYHAGALSALEMIQELINLAQDLKAAYSRGEETGLSQEELAFYDALAEHEKAVEFWAVSNCGSSRMNSLSSSAATSPSTGIIEKARASMRILVKRILRRDGYPPDLSDLAVQTVLAQAETLLRGT